MVLKLCRGDQVKDKHYLNFALRYHISKSKNSPIS